MFTESLHTIFANFCTGSWWTPRMFPSPWRMFCCFQKARVNCKIGAWLTPLSPKASFQHPTRFYYHLIIKEFNIIPMLRDLTQTLCSLNSSFLSAQYMQICPQWATISGRLLLSNTGGTVMYYHTDFQAGH